MNRYEKALEVANKLLNEADVKETDPRVASLKRQLDQYNKQIENLDRQRKPLMLRKAEIQKQLTMLGQEISN